MAPDACQACVFFIRNPTPGIIINHPDGDDVYGGVKIDYKGPVCISTTVNPCLLRLYNVYPYSQKKMWF